MQEYRHYLHTIPEINYKEAKTSEYIYNKLLSFGLEVRKNIVGTGVIGILKSDNDNYTKNIALRAELDALPIEEKNNIEYKSIHEKTMHACGHDGHMAILLGVANYFSKNRSSFDGIIYFIFSPAEEEGAGCKLLINDEYFNSLNIQEVYAIHNWRELNVGEIGISNNVIMGGDHNFSIEILGKGGHGAMPDNAINPNNYIGKVVNELKNIENKYNTVVLTTTNIVSGDTFNVIPDHAVINGTFRYLSKEIEDKVITEMKNIKIDDIIINVNIIEGYIPTINNNECANFCKDIVENMDNIKLVNVTKPSMATEDFSYLLNKIKGCYVWLGSKDSEHIDRLHSSRYDFNDKVLEIGFNYFKDLVMYRLSKRMKINNLPKFGNNLIFLGFIELPTDYTLDIEIGDLLGQVEGIGWRLKKLPYVGCTNINKENFEKLKNELKQSAFEFIPDGKYEYGKLSVISLACTSMSFVLGRNIVDEELRKGYNVKTNDTASSILKAIDVIFKSLNKHRLKVSLLTPYIDSIHNKYKNLIKNNNCDIIVDYNMNLENDSLTSSVTIESIEQIIDEMINYGSEIDIFIIVCSALNVTKKGFIDKMEKRHGIIFLTSNQALLWNSLNIAMPEIERYKIRNIVGYGELFKKNI